MLGSEDVLSRKVALAIAAVVIAAAGGVWATTDGEPQCPAPAEAEPAGAPPAAEEAPAPPKLLGSAQADDLGRRTRHLARFVVPDGVVGSGGAEGGDWSDVALRNFVADRRARREKDKNPAVADADAAEKRRLEQLEKLRQRDAVGLLDSIHAGLAWLAIHQRDDGSFSDAGTVERCTAMKHSPSCLDKWPNAGDAYQVATTALAAIAFLDFRDQDPNGWFDPYLGRALDWLSKQQKADGAF